MAITHHDDLVGSVLTLVFSDTRQRTATVTGVARTKVPFDVIPIAAYAGARLSGGTGPTLSVDLKDDGASILAAAVTVTAGATATATLPASPATIAAGSQITVDYTIGGTSPTWDDITVAVYVRRIGD